MNLQNVNLKKSYTSSLDRVASDFYTPVLSATRKSRRAVGFFSSSVFSVIAVGIAALARNGGSIQLVVSPKLSEEDIAAIQQGYKMRDEIVKSAITRELQAPRNAFEERNLNLLANLIADGIMDIKIALTEKETQTGIFHIKMGLVEDGNGNTVAFSGSMNESLNALELSYESIDVYCSWKSEDELRVADKVCQFNSIWNNIEPNIRIVDFPEIKQEILDRYKRTTIVDYSREQERYEIDPVAQTVEKPWLRTPDNYPPYYEYQLEAMQTWKANGYRGIFDMATGTGKTLTALGALELLCQEKKIISELLSYAHISILLSNG
jgi:hypothetical protein